MAECGEISMMLGAFEDSELEPNEMQEVAFHLARCESCTGILADYSTLGRDLRSIAAEPSLAGFSSAVIARVDRLPQPVLTRIERFIRRQLDSVGSGIAWGGAVAGGRHRDDNSDDAVRAAVRQSRDACDRDRQGGAQRRTRAKSSGDSQRADDGGQRFSCRHLAPRVGEPFGRSLERASQGHHGYLVTGSALGRHDAASR